MHLYNHFKVLNMQTDTWYLKPLGYVNKLDILVPHKLNEIQLTKRISVRDSLLKRNKTDPISKQIITSDEKWDVYDNVVQQR